MSKAIEYDLPCHQCGYNLRGLLVTGRCPECGTAVAVSTEGHLLRYSHPEYVAGLTRGTYLLAGGVGVVLLGFFGCCASAVAGGVGAVVGYGVIVAGTWLLTRPDPGGIGEEEYGVARRLARVATLIGLGGFLLLPAFSGAVPALAGGLKIMGGLGGAAGVVGMVAQMSYLSELACRLPSRQLSDRANLLMYTLGFGYGLLLLSGLVAAISPMISRHWAPEPTVPICFAIVLIPAILIFNVMQLLLLLKFGGALRKECRLAWQHWDVGARAARIQ